MLACADAGDRFSNVKSSFLALFFKMVVMHQVLVESKGLLDTLTTLHDSKDYRLKQTVQIISD